ncbi:MAG: 4-alpha-glucanotransferase, partial [Vicinamibacterales bacterium]
MRLPRASGVLLHPTSLPGRHGSGDCGAAAYHFVDWLVTAGQQLWQILPLTGIGPGHSPYMSRSAFAGNELLIDLDALGHAGWLTDDELAPPPGVSAERVAFDAVVPFRMSRLRTAAARFAAGADAGARADFEDYCRAQADWLDDYALFMALADVHASADWRTWPGGLAVRDPAAIATARAAQAEAVHAWRFCQWTFDRQWAALRHYANSRGVRIVGDTPIFVSGESADVWTHPDLFELDAARRPRVVAGVPPDFFSATGQRWGNPLYRWPSHAADGYAWWIARVRRTFALVDVVRIDHFRGFAAHWEIPADEPTAVNGRWVPGPGAAFFDALERAIASVPIIAEDLGVITPDVDALRRRCGFPGMRVLQFAFEGDAGNSFLPHHYEPDTVVYTGTHDNNTSAGWWAGAPERERAFARAYLGLPGGPEGVTADAEGAAAARALLRAAWGSVADTAVAPMQDVLALPAAARMNFPGQGDGWWTWRFTW